MAQDLRLRQIRAIAGLITVQLCEADAYSDPPFSRADAARVNEDGWTITLFTDRPDTVVRYERVHLSADELDRAWAQAQEYAHVLRPSWDAESQHVLPVRLHRSEAQS
jgi:hypothetical protein